MTMDRNSYHQVSSGASAYLKVRTLQIIASGPLFKCMAWCLTCAPHMCRGRHRPATLCRLARPAITQEDPPRIAHTAVSRSSCFDFLVFFFIFEKTAQCSAYWFQPSLLNACMHCCIYVQWETNTCIPFDFNLCTVSVCRSSKSTMLI